MWLSRSSAFLRGAWRTLPVETLAVAAAAIGAIGLIHSRSELREVWFLRVLLAGVLVTPLAFAAHRLGRRTQAIAAGLVAAGILAALATALAGIDQLDAPTFSWPFRLSVLAAMVVPFVASGRQFARFVRRFFEETTTWGLLWLSALAAVTVVFLALDELFSLHLDHLRLDALIALTAGFILVYLHRLLADDTAGPGRMPELWRRLATTIGAPFVSVMLVILVIYEIAALVRGELPRNMLSPLILAAGFVGFVSTLIITSVLGEDAGAAVLSPAEPHRWARRKTIRLARAFPIVLLALLPMAGWALWVRVDEYGFTPFRVVRAMGLVCLAVASLLGTVRWLRGRGSLTWEVPAVILAFTLAAAFGPASAIDLTIASQRARLGHGLDAVGAGRTVHLDPPATRIEVEPKTYAVLADSIRALAELGGQQALRTTLSGSIELCTDRWRESDCLKRLGIYVHGDYAPVPDHPRSFVHLAAQGRFPIRSGQLAFVDLSHQPGEPAPEPVSSDANPEGGLVLLGDAVAVYEGGAQVARVSLTELMATWQGDRILPARMLPLAGPDGVAFADLAVESLDVQRHGNAPPEVSHLSGVVVWRR